MRQNSRSGHELGYISVQSQPDIIGYAAACWLGDRRKTDLIGCQVRAGWSGHDVVRSIYR